MYRYKAKAGRISSGKALNNYISFSDLRLEAGGFDRLRHFRLKERADYRSYGGSAVQRVYHRGIQQIAGSIPA